MLERALREYIRANAQIGIAAAGETGAAGGALMKPLHEQVEVEIHGQMVKVDVEIAPLVLALNEIPRVETVTSCQKSGGTGPAWVQFYVLDQQERLADDASVCRLLRKIRPRLPPSRGSRTS